MSCPGSEWLKLYMWKKLSKEYRKGTFKLESINQVLQHRMYGFEQISIQAWYEYKAVCN